MVQVGGTHRSFLSRMRFLDSRAAIKSLASNVNAYFKEAYIYSGLSKEIRSIAINRVNGP